VVRGVERVGFIWWWERGWVTAGFNPWVTAR
jgi:hypothetical protein